MIICLSKPNLVETEAPDLQKRHLCATCKYESHGIPPVAKKHTITNPVIILGPMLGQFWKGTALLGPFIWALFRPFICALLGTFMSILCFLDEWGPDERRETLRTVKINDFPARVFFVSIMFQNS